MSLLWVLVVVLLVLWACGYWGVGYTGVRGNNAMHVLLVVVVILVLFELLGGGSLGLHRLRLG